MLEIGKKTELKLDKFNYLFLGMKLIIVLLKKDPKDIVELPIVYVNLAKKIVDVCSKTFPNYQWNDYLIYETKFCELQINKYDLQSELGFHKDSQIFYRELIFGISLISDSNFSFSKQEIETTVLIPNRSLYIMSGASRSKFKHGFHPNSIVNGNARISLTFRKILYTKEITPKMLESHKQKHKTKKRKQIQKI